MKILIVGRCLLPTGFSRITRRIGLELIAMGQFVRWLPLDGNHQYVEFSSIDDLKPPVGLEPERFDSFGQKRIKSQIDDFGPDVVIVINDCALVSAHIAPIRQKSQGIKIIVYTPIDGRLMSPKPFLWLKDVDALVVYSQFAAKEVLSVIELLRPSPQPKLEVIPHGIDSDIFYPFPDRAVAPVRNKISLMARKQILSDLPAGEDAFIILNANRNQSRKQIHTTMQAFKLFSENTSRPVYLYLHMGMHDNGFSIPAYAQQLGIGERLLVSTQSSSHPDFSNQDLNCLYNACDMGLNTSMGEGWGLVSCEHAATGAVQVVPDHSACSEIWQDSGWLVKPVAYHDEVFFQGKLLSAEDVASSIAMAYQDSEKSSRIAFKGYQKMTSPALSWQTIGEQWMGLIWSLI